MSHPQSIVAVVDLTRGLLGNHLADFTEAEMLARTSPAANHAAYQLSHLIRTTGSMVAAFVPDLKFTPPALVAAKAPPTSDDPAAFPPKAELLASLNALLDALKTGILATADADFDKPTPEQFQKFVPTLGQLALMVPVHLGMHLGQIQSIRRKLGKPVLF